MDKQGVTMDLKNIKRKAAPVSPQGKGVTPITR